MTFVDTSFWVAFRNRADGNHETARRLMETRLGASLVTTNHVRGETWTFLRRRAGHRAAVGFLDVTSRSPRLTVVDVTPQQEADAWRWLRRHDERAYSFVDATSFVVMKALRIHEALAFDGDFTAAGFSEARP